MLLFVHVRFNRCNSGVEVINLFAMFIYSVVLLLIISSQSINSIIELLNNNPQIEGMRNRMNSWEKGDSELATAGYDVVGFNLGEADLNLMQRLSNAGTDHRKFMRMMPALSQLQLL